ncbi:MAG: LacI family DNA-binding transcriptional regulator [Kiritimatiellae bacterium]|nr:LacI family DNA-binding transcriptional regulator [Kiritimatiellia bacterium]
MITLSEIGRKAGVSAAAVSYVLAGQTHRVGAATRERILEIARRHDYQPNALVRAIKTKRTESIGVLLTDFRITFFGEILSAVEVAAEKRGYQVLVGQTHSSHARVEKQVRLLRQKRVDGLLVCPNPFPEYYAGLKDSGLPLVFVDGSVPGVEIPCVRSDDLLGAKLAVRHLIGLGHRRIAAFAWSSQQRGPVGDARTAGYEQALREVNLPVDPTLIEETGGGAPDDNRAAIHALLARTKFTALFANNDMAAIAAMEALEVAGKRVPEDVAVIGFANLEEGAHVRPRLSSVDQKTTEIGERAATLLIDLIEHPERKPPVENLTTPELVVRESCGARKQAESGTW